MIGHEKAMPWKPMLKHVLSSRFVDLEGVRERPGG